MTAPASVVALLARRTDLTEPREWLVDETELLEIARERIALQRDLWQAVRDYETANRHLDEQVAAHRRAEARRTVTLETAETDADAAEWAARRAQQVTHDRRSRARLHAEANGLTYTWTAHTDADGYRHERHLLIAPAGHPALTDLPSWAPRPTPIRHAGGIIVPTLTEDTLEAVEAWLGLPHDPSAGSPPPLRYPKESDR